MFERLINNNIPYKQLMTQSRMLPELSIYLKRRYPLLADNTDVVLKKLKGRRPMCLERNVFWWDTNFQEESARSYSNDEEAARVVAIAVFLIVQGIDPKRITILAPYNGQVREII
jgi:superfamily I DNA and/or RNA helicase